MKLERIVKNYVHIVHYLRSFTEKIMEGVGFGHREEAQVLLCTFETWIP